MLLALEQTDEEGVLSHFESFGKSEGTLFELQSFSLRVGGGPTPQMPQSGEPNRDIPATVPGVNSPLTPQEAAAFTAAVEKRNEEVLQIQSEKIQEIRQ